MRHLILKKMSSPRVALFILQHTGELQIERGDSWYFTLVVFLFFSLYKGELWSQRIQCKLDVVDVRCSYLVLSALQAPLSSPFHQCIFFVNPPDMLCVFICQSLHLSVHCLAAYASHKLHPASFTCRLFHTPLSLCHPSAIWHKDPNVHHLVFLRLFTSFVLDDLQVMGWMALGTNVLFV